VVDDAFFYLGIAKNIAAGNGATFDGSTMTNGFHPIYAILLVPIFWLISNSLEMPLHWALTILSIFNVFTGLVIFFIVKDISGRFAGLLTSFIWLFNPYVIMISLSGVEVGVAAFFLSLTIYQYLKIRSTGTFTSHRIIPLGILTALAVLSRVDAVFLFIGITLEIFYLSYSKNKDFLISFSKTGLYVSTTFAVLLPWFLWNLFNFGTIRQISGVTLPHIAHNMYLMKHQTYVSLDFIRTELFHLKVWLQHIFKFSGGIVLFVILAATFVWVTRGNFTENIKKLSAQMLTFNFALCSVIFLVSFYALYFWGWLRPWYYLSVILIVTIYIGIFAGQLQKVFISNNPATYRQSAPVLLLLIFIVLYFPYQGFHVWGKGLFPFQKQLYESAEWLRDNTEKDSRIGAISAGIYGFLTQRTVDLAGVVNREAYKAMKERRIFSYLREKNIDYLVDREDMIHFYSKRFDREGFIDKLTLIKRFGDKPSDVVAYRINTTEKRDSRTNF
jgi:hypothetical protein